MNCEKQENLSQYFFWTIIFDTIHCDSNNKNRIVISFFIAHTFLTEKSITNKRQTQHMNTRYIVNKY